MPEIEKPPVISAYPFGHVRIDVLAGAPAERHAAPKPFTHSAPSAPSAPHSAMMITISRRLMPILMPFEHIPQRVASATRTMRCRFVLVIIVPQMTALTPEAQIFIAVIG